MDISPVTSLPGNSNADKTSVKLADTFDSFLTLLTAQLTNQDPLDPLDPNEFTDQLVSFTNVEQSIATNKNLEQLLASYQSNELASAVSYIGKAIEAPGATSVLKNGSARWSYQLESQSEATTVKVVNSSGKTVFQAVGQTGLGRHEFQWDGNDLRGNPLPDGPYTLAVSAADSQNTAVATTTNLIATAQGILTQDGVNKVDVGGFTVPLSSIVAVNSDTDA
jgi:flagellar basal-body rod modification protein FlgD